MDRKEKRLPLFPLNRGFGCAGAAEIIRVIIANRLQYYEMNPLENKEDNVPCALREATEIFKHYKKMCHENNVDVNDSVKREFKLYPMPLLREQKKLDNPHNDAADKWLVRLVICTFIILAISAATMPIWVK